MPHYASDKVDAHAMHISHRSPPAKVRVIIDSLVAEPDGAAQLVVLPDWTGKWIA